MPPHRGAHAFEKRKKELARKERQKAKVDRRSQRDDEKRRRSESGEPEDDPDIAGIVPGPQEIVEEP